MLWYVIDFNDLLLKVCLLVITRNALVVNVVLHVNNTVTLRNFAPINKDETFSRKALFAKIHVVSYCITLGPVLGGVRCIAHF